MKELSIEQKAKAYDEALKRAKITLDCCGSTSIITKNTIYDIFPELQESEDEKVRKEIVSIFHSLAEGKIPSPINYADIFTWLEKQGEQKSAIIIPKFRVGDEIKTTNEAPLTITKITNSGYWSEDLLICSFENSAKWELVGKLVDKVEPKFHEGQWITNGDYIWKIVEIKPLDYILQSQDGNIVDDTISHVDEQFHSFTIQDAKDGDVLACPNDAGDRDVVFIFKNINIDEGWVFCFCASDANGCFCTNNDYVGNSNSTNISPATKEQRNLLFQKMHEAGYEWDAEKKELKKIEQKPADKVGPKFKVKYAGSEYNVFETKNIGGVTFYGIEDEPNHIDCVKADNCEIISVYGIKESGLSIPTKPVMFSEKKPDTDFSDLRTWKYIVDAVWTEKEGIGQYLDSPFTEEVAKKLQKRFGNIEQKSQRMVSAEAKEAMYDNPAAWSEKDENVLEDIEEAIINYWHGDTKDILLDWLKSIKQRIGGKL